MGGRMQDRGGMGSGGEAATGSGMIMAAAAQYPTFLRMTGVHYHIRLVQHPRTLFIRYIL